MIIPYTCPECKADINGEYTTSKHEAICPECGKSSKIPYNWIEPGVTIGNGYKVEKKLDELSQAKLFLAYQEAMDRHVQLKILPPDYGEDEEEYKRFKREIKLTATLNHPNILAAFGAGEDAGVHFLIRQHKPGETLEEYCHREGCMPEKKLLECMLPVADALKVAWNEQQVLHRNLKPENILLTEDDSAMLIDLGIAKSVTAAADITGTGFTVGTPEYMSPEQVQAKGDMDCRSDIYSFCILLYRMSTGEVPFEDPSAVMVMQKQINEPPIPAQFKNKALSTQFSMMLDKGLKKEKTERFDDWESLIAEMKSILKGEKEKPAKADKPGNRPDTATHTRKKDRGSQGKKRSKDSAEDAAAQRRRDIERIAQHMYAAKAKRTKLFLYVLSSLIPILFVAAFLYVQSNRQDTREKVRDLIEQASGYEKKKDYISAIQSLTEIKSYVGEDSEEWRQAERKIQALKRQLQPTP